MNNPKDTSLRSVAELLFETGLLKRVRRSGWWVVGIDQPESVADHCFRCAVLGYALAKLEAVDAHTVTMMCLFNDLHEARINDAHKMATRYFDHARAEDTAFGEQVQALPPEMAGELSGWRREYTQQQTPESIVARDADILECLIQAKEYYEAGHEQAALFLRTAPQYLKSESARNLWRQTQDIPISEWWQRVSEFRR